MPGQYDYSINIPQPPAQNFLQSLLGIQQLKGLQQQGEIAQQQAGIQAQQAQFAQQMQPLQMQHLQEQINASKTQQGLIGVEVQKAKFDLEQKQKQQTALNDLASDSSKWTQDNFMKLGIQYPQSDWINLAKMRAALPTKALNFGDNLGQQLVLSTQIGDNKTGQKLLDDAVKVSKEDPELNIIAPKIEQLSKQYKDFPEKTSVIAAMGLQMLSPDKAKAMFGAMDERLKSEETQAKIDETKARTLVELSKVPKPGQVNLSEKQQGEVNALTRQAADTRNTIQGLNDQLDLIANFAKEKPTEFSQGSNAAFQNWISGKTGNTTALQNLRSGLQPSATKEFIAKASALKGSLSDKEGAMLSKGAPDVMTAGINELLSWGRLTNKINLTEADMNDLDAAWQQNVGTLQTKAKSGFDVSNISVKAGDSYSQVRAKLMADHKKKSQDQMIEDARKITEINKAISSATPLTPNMYNLSGAPQQPAAGPNQATGAPNRQSLLNKYR
jgi:hypothetical protein